MAKFLVDANLPVKFRFWSGVDFLHVAAIDPTWSDSQVWKYSELNDLTIITKDADFSARIIAVSPPPRVIHFKTGNLRLKDFHDFIAKHWNEIRRYSETHKLVNVYADKITGIK